MLRAAQILEMTATAEPAIAGAEAREQDASRCGLIEPALLFIEEAHIRDRGRLMGQKIIDVPLE